MDSTLDDGGPAFPLTINNGPDKFSICLPGMTLRDWFAGQALSGVISNLEDGVRDDDIVNACYLMADAMLARRKI